MAQNETYLQIVCNELFDTEAAVYHALQDHQGNQVPRLLASVWLDTGSDAQNNQQKDESGKDIFKIKGLLLEYITGVKFSDIAESAIPQTSWQSLVDQAIESVGIFGRHNILNEDVRPDNILAFTDINVDCGYRPILIDFGHSRFREEDETDFDWGRAKHSTDEEGAVGFVMGNRLRRCGFEVEYTNPWPWIDFAEEEGETEEDTERKRREMRLPAHLKAQ